jgi:hypothetical protein
MKLNTALATLAFFVVAQAFAQTPPAPSPTPTPAASETPAAAAPSQPERTAATPSTEPSLAASQSPPAQTTAAVAAAPAKKPLKRPPGYKIVKRDGVPYYCRKDASIGSRLETIKCYSEAEMEVQLAMQQEERDNMHQRMRTCVGVCGAQ